MSIFKLSLLSILVIGIIASCSVLMNDTDKDVRNFITSFQKSLSLPDDKILKQFQTSQTSQSLLEVIKILQNKNQNIQCDAQFNLVKITKDEEVIKVEIPTTFTIKDEEANTSEPTLLTLWLKAKDKTYIIVQINGQEFYQAFVSFKNDNKWALERKLAYEERQPIYKKAKELEQQFDSVIWYATYNKEHYFYVVKGQWENFFMAGGTRNKKNTDAKMGLVNFQGEVIIPVEYDLIGTISFDNEQIVEVKKEGKTGYFNIKTKQLIVESNYDMIIPYKEGESVAIVKQDTVYGWLDGKYQYSEGFPTDSAKNLALNFGFLKRQFSFTQNSHH
jgi:hypothetical protein